MKVLAELIERVGGRGRGFEGRGPECLDLRLDSRELAPGDLFAALAGGRGHGLDHVPQARARGAVALLVADEDRGRAADAGLPLWLHPDPREAVGLAAAALHDHPSRGIPTVAVTGTNGKTTVTWMVAELLRSLGRRPALFGSVGYFLAGDEREPSTHTTPDAPHLQRLLARHRRAGGDAVVLEASSHALDQHRLAGLELDVAVFTNLTRDHLDYHGSMEAYRAAKARLFHMLPAGGVAVLPVEGDTADEFARIAADRGARVIRYGTGGSRADLTAEDVAATADGHTFSITGMGITDRSNPLSVHGRHNVDNLVAACAAVLSTGVDPAALRSGLTSISLPPGRLEPATPEGHPFRCLVDYAHTPDALRATLEGLRRELDAAGRGRLLCVFGCGGDRDRGKRPEMGAVVAALADVAIVTSDNPRSEDPERIVAEVLAGCAGGGAELLTEVDRRAAIALACARARPGDLVLIAGKGHEDYQILPTGRIHFDDREVVREVTR